MLGGPLGRRGERNTALLSKVPGSGSVCAAAAPGDDFIVRSVRNGSLPSEAGGICGNPPGAAASEAHWLIMPGPGIAAGVGIDHADDAVPRDHLGKPLHGACTAPKLMQAGELWFRRNGSAAGWYSLIMPLSTRWRRIGLGTGMAAGWWLSWGASWARDWWGR